MPDLIVATNTYVSLEDAEQYFAMRLRSDIWVKSDDKNKKIALLQATRDLNRLIPRKKTNSPLTFVVNKDTEYATCEQAIYLLGIDVTDEQRKKDILSGVQSVTVGKASEQYADNAYSKASSSLMNISPDALAYLKPYLIGSVPIC